MTASVESQNVTAKDNNEQQKENDYFGFICDAFAAANNRPIRRQEKEGLSSLMAIYGVAAVDEAIRAAVYSGSAYVAINLLKRMLTTAKSDVSPKRLFPGPKIVEAPPSHPFSPLSPLQVSSLPTHPSAPMPSEPPSPNLARAVEAATGNSPNSTELPDHAPPDHALKPTPWQERLISQYNIDLPTREAWDHVLRYLAERSPGAYTAVSSGLLLSLTNDVARIAIDALWKRVQLKPYLPALTTALSRVSAHPISVEIVCLPAG